MRQSQEQMVDPRWHNWILIGIGANLPGPFGATPLEACRAVVSVLEDRDNISLVAKSPWYESAPVPASDQPRYINGVVALTSELTAGALMTVLHELESRFGRERRTRNEARTMDLDLLAYRRQVAKAPNWPVVPHPQLCERLFVLLPLRDVAPDWRHPVDGRTVDQLIDTLAPDQSVRRLDEGAFECGET